MQQHVRLRDNCAFGVILCSVDAGLSTERHGRDEQSRIVEHNFYVQTNLYLGYLTDRCCHYLMTCQQQNWKGGKRYFYSYSGHEHAMWTVHTGVPPFQGKESALLRLISHYHTDSWEIGATPIDETVIWSRKQTSEALEEKMMIQFQLKLTAAFI